MPENEYLAKIAQAESAKMVEGSKGLSFEQAKVELASNPELVDGLLSAVHYEPIQAEWNRQGVFWARAQAERLERAMVLLNSPEMLDRLNRIRENSQSEHKPTGYEALR